MTYRTVVTGASSGIGRATALLLAKDRHALVLNARKEGVLTQVAESCLVAGAVSVATVPGDIADPETAPMLADAVRESGSGEIVLVNNAGGAEFGPFHVLDIESSVTMVEVALCGAMRAAYALIPLMLENERGTIVNVASIAAKHDFPNAQAYCAAKTALLSLSRTLALDYRRQGIRVTSIVPGATDTPLWNAMAICPSREDMIPVAAVAETVKYVIDLPRDRTIDEIVVTPPKGVL